MRTILPVLLAVVTLSLALPSSTSGAWTPGDRVGHLEKVDPAIRARQPAEVGWAVVLFRAYPAEAELDALAAKFDVVHPWHIIPAAGVVGTREAIIALASDPRVELIDASVGAFALKDSVPQIHVPEATAVYGVTGSGVTVASIDTGIDDRHPDLVGQVALKVAFDAYWAAGTAASGTESAAGAGMLDPFGHGTFTSAIVAGRGSLPGVLYPEDRYRGVAPGARLISVQPGALPVLDANFSSFGGPRIISWAAIDAIQWVTEHRDEHDIRVATNSWGFWPAHWGQMPCYQHPVSKAVLASLAAEPSLVWVFAAGNEGAPAPGRGTIRIPGCLPEVITVGAVDKSGNFARYSSQGPTHDGFDKPDVVAPGSRIVSAHPLYQGVLGALREDPLNSPRDPAQRPFYIQISGTSYATPHVAGVAALMIEAAPCVSHAQVKGILQATAVDRGDPGYDHKFGWGIVDAHEAVGAAVSLCP